MDIPERTAEGIVEWLNNELARWVDCDLSRVGAQKEKKEKEMKESMEMAGDLDDDETVEEFEDSSVTEESPTEEEL